MVERRPGEYPDKAEKIANIKKLLDPVGRDAAFERLCGLFSKSWELSGTQLHNLADNLREAGFLNYRAKYLDSAEADEETAFDSAQWHIEHDGATQVTAMRIAHGLLADIDTDTRADLAVSLLNAGHLLGSKICDLIDQSYESEPSLKLFLGVEQKALRMANGLGDNLVQKNLVETYDAFSLEEFRREEGLDYFIVMVSEPGLYNLQSGDLRTLFERAQHLIYLGYGMALRDKPISNQRLEEMY